MAFGLRLPRIKLDKKTLTIGGVGLGIGIIGYYLLIQPRGGLGAFIPGLPSMDESDVAAQMMMPAQAMEGEELESGLFVSYDDGFTVGNRVTVS